MNYIYCSDLKNYQVLGTFLELLYHLKVTKNEEITPIVIVGTRDAKKLPTLKNFLSEKLSIKNGIYETNDLINLGDAKKEKLEALTKKATEINELQSLEHNGINIGIGIASSLVSKHRCTEIDLKSIQDELTAYIQQSILFLDTFQETISKTISTDDTVYIYNGRHYNTYPQSLVCEKFGIDLRYYERMNSWRNLKIQKIRIHDFEETSRIVSLFWNKSNDENKNIIGEEFFSENLSNKFTRSFSEKMDLESPYISFFVSSEDEFASLDPRINLSNIFRNQREALEWLADWVANQKRYKLVVRLHPNQSNICLSDYKYWHNFSGPNLIVIPSKSSIDSYDIIIKSSKVISYLSTTGIEATRAGIPSITLGNPPYKGLNAAYEPGTKDEIAQLLDKEDLKPKPKECSLPYGYYNRQYGPKINFYTKIGLKSFEEYAFLIK